MKTVSPILAQPAGLDFRTGLVALRIRRGNVSYLVPRQWVRSVVSLNEATPLPRTKKWVVGLAVHDGRPVPVIDLALCTDGTDNGFNVGVLLGAPEQAAFCLVVSDSSGRFVSVPSTARLESADGWLMRVQGCAQPTWWLEAGRLATEFKR